MNCYKQFSLLVLALFIGSLAALLTFRAILAHEDRQATADFDLQLEAAAWRVEL